MGAFKVTLIADFLHICSEHCTLRLHAVPYCCQRPFVLHCKLLSAYMQGSELCIHVILCLLGSRAVSVHVYMSAHMQRTNLFRHTQECQQQKGQQLHGKVSPSLHVSVCLTCIWHVHTAKDFSKLWT